MPEQADDPFEQVIRENPALEDQAGAGRDRGVAVTEQLDDAGDQVTGEDPALEGAQGAGDDRRIPAPEEVGPGWRTPRNASRPKSASPATTGLGSVSWARYSASTSALSR
jgi:hypothetical protein